MCEGLLTVSANNLLCQPYRLLSQWVQMIYKAFALAQSTIGDNCAEQK